MTLSCRPAASAWGLGALAATALGLVAAAADNASHGRWLAEDIGGGGVVDRIQTVIELDGDGRVSGSGGCNRIMGSASVSGDGLTFGRMASTRMACPPAVMAQERRFLAALEQVRRWRVDAPRAKLILSDETGRVLVVLARM